MNHDTSRLARWMDEIEETSIAVCLGLMTLITFANVVARYAFNSNILWGIEVTVYLFAWLVLMGASYGVKKHIHIGVDVIINLASPRWRYLLALLSAAACIAFAVLLTIGAWEYWWPFVTKRAWLETDDIPMPSLLMFLADWVNEGEAWERLPRFIPYAALPLGMSLLTWRFLQLAWQVVTGRTDKLIATHEVEEELEKTVAELREDAK